jgi:hypothetical protein
MSYKTNNNADPSGTGFCNHVILATTEQLREVLGEAIEERCDKSSVQWVVIGPDNEVVTVYDWKEPMDMRKVTDVEIAWHIGARRPIHSMLFRIWLESQLKMKR